MASLRASNTSFATKASRSARPSARRAVVVNAKYGENSKYFDLKDLENTTGSWDMYGVDEPKRYPGLQETFFKQSTDILTRREALNAFVALSGVGAIALFGLKGSKDAQLPITKGPDPAKTENGKGGTLRSRI